MAIKIRDFTEEEMKEIPVQLELGPGRSRTLGTTIAFDMCGNDYVQPEVQMMIGFEAFPLPDNSVDKVVAVNMMEHLPRASYFPVFDVFDTQQVFDWRVHRPIIYTIEEVYRVLKVGGEFHMYNPASYTGASCGDPTHLSEWDTSCIQPYFQYDCQIYDMRFNFDVVTNQRNGNEFKAILKKNNEEIFIPNPPSYIWRPASIKPENYFKLTYERLIKMCHQCGYMWDADKKGWVDIR